MTEVRLITPPPGEVMSRQGSLDSLDEPLQDTLPAFSKENASAFTSPVSGDDVHSLAPDSISSGPHPQKPAVSHPSAHWSSPNSAARGDSDNVKKIT